jgi:hypothetical protein
VLVRSALGFSVVLGSLALGALAGRWRRSGRPLLRSIGSKVHRVVGVLAVAVLAVLVVTALRLLRG